MIDREITIRIRLNEPQQQTMDNLLRLLLGAHHVNLTVRYEGEDRKLQADWLADALLYGQVSPAPPRQGEPGENWQLVGSMSVPENVDPDTFEFLGTCQAKEFHDGNVPHVQIKELATAGGCYKWKPLPEREPEVNSKSRLKRLAVQRQAAHRPGPGGGC